MRRYAALLLAAGEGHERVLQSLLRAGASTGRTDREEETALMKAAAEGHLGAVDALLRHEPRQIGQQNRDRFTALHYAASVGHLAVVAALLQQGAAPRAAEQRRRAGAAVGVSGPSIVNVLPEPVWPYAKTHTL